MARHWKITALISVDPENIKTIEVDANGIEKAIINGTKKLQKKYKTKEVTILSCEKNNE